jgi:glycosyltransferase involved in cell wall biosynthesis
VTETALSLVVCTRNRATQLAAALASLERLTCAQEWEIVFVDNGSTDATADILASFAAAAPDERRVVREETPGLGRARNTGWRAARGGIVAFTDDDCYPEPDFPDRMLDAFAEEEIGYVAGRSILFDPNDAPIGIRTDTEPVRYPPRYVFEPGQIHGANFAFRRSVLERIDGFDPITGAGTPYPFEDVDAVMRASRAGFTGAYDPRPTVRHHHGRSTREAVRAISRQYRQGRGAYFAKFIARPGQRFALLKLWYFGLAYWGWHTEWGWAGVPIELRWGLAYLRDARRARRAAAAAARADAKGPF